MDGGSHSCFPRAALAQAFAERLGQAQLGQAESTFIEDAHEDCGPGEFPDMEAADVAAGLAEFPGSRWVAILLSANGHPETQAESSPTRTKES